MEPLNKAPDDFLKPYNSLENETKILDLWEKSGYANPDVCIEKGVTRPDADTFSIVLPPPNVTGTLHMGHAAMLAIEDILIRYHRMRGYKTLWIPGTDSAAIATQSKVEEALYKEEKKTRHDIGRENLLARIDIFTEASKEIIIDQTKRMGSSLDWSRYAYTMDEKRYKAVMTAFVRMYEAGLIYRGDRIVNWDPKLQTTVSDEEIEYKEQTDPFYHFQYGPFVIGTVRPETKFGDKYVVMHPDDKRYSEYEHGQKINLEWINGPITATIIKDRSVDMEFGSGVMTITPAHSLIDFEIAKRHGLDIEQVIDDRGILLPIAGEFAGQHIKKARAAIVEKLQAKGLVAKIDEKYVHNVATNSRGSGMIEPQIKRQWFVGVNKEFMIADSKIPGVESGSTTTLKAVMRAAVENGGVEIVPDHFKKTYFHWIDNLRDWCISRQIWFGHRIPVWHRSGSGPLKTEALELLKEIKSSKREGVIGSLPKNGQKAVLEAGKSIKQSDGNEKILETDMSIDLVDFQVVLGPDNEDLIPRLEAAGFVQDSDTLDTWFSSGLWTFSTLGWPENTTDLQAYHPTSVLETGYDILFFWVARMVLMSGFLLGDVPFRRVYLHGLVRDGQGRKMSKSLGNIINPLDMIEKYGADATRLSLIIGAQIGNDLKLSEDRVRGYKHFANKVWNITRFVLENRDPSGVSTAPLNTEDEELVREAHRLALTMSENIDTFRLDLAADAVYHYVWHRFADEIIEESKAVIKSGDAQARASKQRMLHKVLIISLKLLHPFMPFVTEAIWQHLPAGEAGLPQKDADILMVAKWPI